MQFEPDGNSRRAVLVASILAVIAVVVAFALPLRADDASDRVAIAIAIENAESNPWFPPVPNKPDVPPPPAPKAEVKKDERPIVYRMHASWCNPCRALAKTLTKDLRAKLPFQIIDWDVDTKGWMGASEIPAFWWKSPQGNLRHGWKNIEDLIRTWEASQKGAPKAAAGPLTPAQLKAFAATYRGPLRGVKGNDFHGHLLDDNHRFAPWQLAGLTQHECELIHGAHHNGYLTTDRINTPAKSTTISLTPQQQRWRAIGQSLGYSDAQMLNYGRRHGLIE